MKRFYFPITFSIVLLVDIAQAETRTSAEQLIGSQIANCLRILSSLHNGVVATNWPQLSECLDLRKVDEILPHLAPIEKSYTFVTNEVKISVDGREGRILVIRNSPIQQDEKMERYIIWQPSSGEIQFSPVPELKFAETLTAAGLELTEDGLVARAAHQSRVAGNVPGSAQLSPGSTNPVKGSSVDRTGSSSATDGSGFRWQTVCLVLGIGVFALFAIFGRLRRSRD